MKVLIRMLSVLSNRSDYLKRRFEEEQRFLDSDERFASWEQAADRLESEKVPDGQADRMLDFLVSKNNQPKEGRPERGASTKDFIMWLRLELQRRWLAWLIDFTVTEIQKALVAVQPEDQGKNVLYVVVLPEFYFTDRSRGLTRQKIENLNGIADMKIYHTHFSRPFEERVFFEFANGWLPTYQKLKTLESLTAQNLILFGGTIIWNLILQGQEIINNTLPVFFDGRCQFLWDKQNIPDGEIDPSKIHPMSALPWLSVESFSIAARAEGKVPIPAFEYRNDAVSSRPIVFAVDICRDFIEGEGKQRVTAAGITPDFHVITAAGARFDMEHVCAKSVAFYADNCDALDGALAGVVDAKDIAHQFMCRRSTSTLCWVSELTEWELDG